MNLLLKPITQDMFLLMGTLLMQIPVPTVHRGRQDGLMLASSRSTYSIVLP
jgi:hypothetical protein